MPLTSYVILDKFLDSSGPWHPSCAVGTAIVPTHRVVLRTERVNM